MENAVQQREKLVQAMKTMPEKLADAWIKKTQETNDNIEEMQKTFDEQIKTIDQLNVSIKEKDEKIQQLSSNLFNSETQYQTKVEELTNVEEQNRKLTKELKQLKKEAEKITTDNCSNQNINKIMTLVKEFYDSINKICTNNIIEDTTISQITTDNSVNTEDDIKENIEKPKRTRKSKKTVITDVVEDSAVSVINEAGTDDIETSSQPEEISNEALDDIDVDEVLQSLGISGL